jgi:hypothetical protein
VTYPWRNLAPARPDPDRKPPCRSTDITLMVGEPARLNVDWTSSRLSTSLDVCTGSKSAVGPYAEHVSEEPESRRVRTGRTMSQKRQFRKVV